MKGALKQQHGCYISQDGAFVKTRWHSTEAVLNVSYVVSTILLGDEHSTMQFLYLSLAN